MADNISKLKRALSADRNLRARLNKAVKSTSKKFIMRRYPST